MIELSPDDYDSLCQLATVAVVVIVAVWVIVLLIMRPPK